MALLSSGLGPANRTNDTPPSVAHLVWRAAEFQEREIFDLYGIIFDGHPDLRRIPLCGIGFTEFPMRKDYVEPDDYEYEPTPHDDVLAKNESVTGHLTEGTTGR
jgi:NADH-quinone oxidoreductase subunit C